MKESPSKFRTLPFEFSYIFSRLPLQQWIFFDEIIHSLEDSFYQKYYEKFGDAGVLSDGRLRYILSALVETGFIESNRGHGYKRLCDCKEAATRCATKGKGRNYTPAVHRCTNPVGIQQMTLDDIPDASSKSVPLTDDDIERIKATKEGIKSAPVILYVDNPTKEENPLYKSYLDALLDKRKKLSEELSHIDQILTLNKPIKW